MASMNFPAAPTNGQVYTYAGKSWTWNGTGWIITPATPVTPEAGAKIFLGAFAPAAGSVIVNLAQYGSTYDSFEFVILARQTTGSNPALCCRFSTDGGVSWWSGAGHYYGAALYTNSATTWGPIGNTSSPQIQLTTSMEAGNNNLWAYVVAEMFKPFLTGQVKSIFYRAGHYISGWYYIAGNSVLMPSAAPVTHVMLFFNDGSAFDAASTFRLYGIK